MAIKASRSPQVPTTVLRKTGAPPSLQTPNQQWHRSTRSSSPATLFFSNVNIPIRRVTRSAARLDFLTCKIGMNNPPAQGEGAVRACRRNCQCRGWDRVYGPKILGIVDLSLEQRALRSSQGRTAEVGKLPVSLAGPSYHHGHPKYLCGLFIHPWRAGASPLGTAIEWTERGRPESWNWALGGGDGCYPEWGGLSLKAR